MTADGSLRAIREWRGLAVFAGSRYDAGHASFSLFWGTTLAIMQTKRPLNIVLAVPDKLPCVGYGGTGRQVEWLADELVALGHSVTLMVPPGSSHPRCRVIEVSTGSDLPSAIPADADVLHLHSWHLSEAPVPFLITQHGISRKRSSSDPVNWCFVSRRHAELHGRETFVYNGFPVDRYRLAKRKTDWLLFLAGIHRAGKNVTRAIDLARRYDFPLDIAGGRRWRLLSRSVVRNEGAFFKSLGPRYRFHGIVDGDRKLDLLGEAAAFLMPIRWEEPFGMAPVEAMLCGTPVLATRMGAMPEVVSERAGAFFDTDEEFAAALDHVRALRPQDCRDYAADSFPIRKTALGYLELYRRLLDGETLR